MSVIHTTPTNFAVDLTALAAGDTLMLADGIYTGDWHAPNILTIPASVTLQAESGARPVLTSSDDTPPRVDVLMPSIVDGLWFGSATKPTTNDTVIITYSQAQMKNCTFFNYDQCLLTQQTGYNTLVDACRFVNCGYHNKSHDMYITNNKQTGIYGTRVQDCINIGGQGWKYHAYGGIVSDTEILRNFAGALDGGDVGYYGCYVVSTGIGTITNNVFWSTTSTSEQLQINSMPSGSVIHNLTGRCLGWIPNWLNDDIQRSDNSFIDPYRIAWTSGIGTNYTRADMPTVLGVSADALDAACTAINTSFTTQTIAQILADATIESNFTIIDAARLAWAGNTPAPEPIPEPMPAPDTTFVSPRRSGRVIFLIQNNPEEEVVEAIKADTDDDEMALISHAQKI